MLLQSALHLNDCHFCVFPETAVHLKGKPVQVMVCADDHSFKLNIEALESIFKNTDQRNIAVVSVAGAYRQGKSFILDYFLRYLNAQVGRHYPILAIQIKIIRTI